MEKKVAQLIGSAIRLHIACGLPSLVKGVTLVSFSQRESSVVVVARDDDGVSQRFMVRCSPLASSEPIQSSVTVDKSGETECCGKCASPATPNEEAAPTAG